MLIGIDEVGRGCWAGPLVVVAARPKTALPLALKDSKLLSSKKRALMYKDISASCEIGEGWVHPAEIDKYGLTKAMQYGVLRALQALGAHADDEIVIDGSINYCPAEFTNVRAIIKADQTEPIVSAASIYAKVTRDKYMAYMDEIYPLYGFGTHVGYGTALHQAKLKAHGPCAIHRLSFRPLRAYGLEQ